MIIDDTTSNLCFDDILLVPKHSNVTSRSNVNISSNIGNLKNPDAFIKLDKPFIIAPMEFINSNKMIKAITDSGGIGFIHRFQHDEKRISQLKDVMELCKNNHLIGFSIHNVDIDNKKIIKDALNLGVKILLIDTAFGHTQISIDYVKKLRSIVPNNIHIMSGNVSSYEAYKNLMDAGCDSVRVGIGGGAACITRVVTGFGVPVLASIMDIYKNVEDDFINGIISDGGINNNGDIVKALGAGASAVMMGSFFAGHEECDGEKDGKFLFRGLASKSIQTQGPNQDLIKTKNIHIEGTDSYLDNKGKVLDTINQMTNNVKSGFSYCGSENLKSFQNDCKFIKISHQSLKESQSRI
jgi:IMP dehydrogenase